MDVTFDDIQSAVHAAARPEKVAVLGSFFKIGEGEYGYGDVFIGVTVPDNRAIARRFASASIDVVMQLLRSEIHELRMCGFLILVRKYALARTPEEKKAVCEFYLSVLRCANNWDLVDLSAPYILGDYLLSADRSVLYTLMDSDCMWERRVSIVSTLTLVRHGHFDDALSLAARCIGDSEELLWKAAGWVLREIGKKSEPALKGFLDAWHDTMPRVMLRYSIERLGKEDKMLYMNKKRDRKILP